MALIFSPLTEEVLEGPYQPLPKSVFLMLQLGKGISVLETEIDKTVSGVLKTKKLEVTRASTIKSQKDYLVKIIQLIRGSGFGVAIFSEFTPSHTLANIFFEIALCNLLGKPVILVKSEGAKAPSDFVRTEWVTYNEGKTGQLIKDFSESVQSVLQLAGYYETLGDLAIEAEDVDLELAFERYRQSYLIDGRKKVKAKLNVLNKRARNNEDMASNLTPAKLRFRNSTQEFMRFLENI